MRRIFFVFCILGFSSMSAFAQEVVESSNGLLNCLKERAGEDSFRVVATVIFFCAILHTFFASYFVKLSKKAEHAHKEQHGHNSVSFKATILHFLGEVEAIFGIWLIPLIVFYIFYEGWGSTVAYFESRHYTEPLFVFVIMSMASTRPILHFAEKTIQMLVKTFGSNKPSHWWLSILTVGPLLGSFITEPAAMTICALLLSKRIFSLSCSNKFKYATLGLLFVNISVGGVLTNFAAPPVLMVAHKWGWSSMFMLKNFGVQAIIGIFAATIFYFICFRSEFKRLDEKTYEELDDNGRLPVSIVVMHLLFLAWTVFTSHHEPLFIGGFLFFLAFVKATDNFQTQVQLKGPVLVAFFLAGLVTHGGLQNWWIEPVLGRLGDSALFFGSAALTAFNDNAAITYLASLVPDFTNNLVLQKAVVAGAVTGGGLTVIANAPNPAGQSLLSKHFSNGIIVPLYLLLGAIIPTAFIALSFRLISF